MAEGGRAEGVYEFGDFRLLAAQRRLTARSDGRPIELTPKALDTLHFLVQHPGELLDKSTLIAAVWPNVVVEENNLNQVVSTLRRALGDGSGGRRFIVTVPGRGYQFVAPVRQVPDAAPSPAPAVSVLTGDRASIAVLPLVNLTRDPEKEYFGDGMAEELINMLTRVPGLKVPARTSSFAYKGRNIDARQIASDLGVDALLEGSVRSAGDRIRLTVQLVDGHSGYHLWSQNYDRDFGDLFALQDELASAIVQAIRDTLNRAVDSVAQGPPAQDVEAYQLYLRGRVLLERGTEENLRRAVELLRQAVARDPTFARAHSAIGLASWVAFFLKYPVPDALQHAEREAEHALALDPKLAEAKGVLGTVYAARLEWLKADAALRAAQALAENDAFTRTQHALHISLAMGHCRQAVREIGAMHRLAPANFLVAGRLGSVHLISGSPEALKYIELAVDLGYPRTLDPMPIMYGLVALRAQRYAEAANHLVYDTSVRAVAGENAVRLALDALASGATTAQAIAALRAVELNATPRTRVHNGLGVICWLYTLLGALDYAYESANRVLDEMARSGPVWVFPGGLWLPEMRSFRQDPRFQGLVTRLGLMPYWEKYGPPDGCELRGGSLVCH